MRPRFPLYLQVLAWFFLNLAVVGGACWLFVRSKIGSERVLMSMVEPRVQAISSLLVRELLAAERGEWETVLERHAEANDIRIALFSGPGQQVAGSGMALPPEVRRRLLPSGPPPGGAPVPPPGGPRPPERQGAGDGWATRPPTGPLPPLRPVPVGEPRRFPRVIGPFPHEMVRPADGEAAWFVVRVPLHDPQRPGGPALQLVLGTESLSAGGFVPDLTPWLWGLAGLMVLTGLGWLPFVRRVTGALRATEQVTARMAAGDFQARAPETSPDEIGALGRSVNALGSRLSGFVEGHRRFMGDIAHELCTPLARMQMAAGALRQRAPENLAVRVDDLTEEVDAMSGLVAELLAFSRAGLAPERVPLRACPVLPLLRGVLEREQFPEGRFRVDVPESLAAHLEPGLFNRAAGNVVRNVLRHAGPAARLAITGRLVGAEVVLEFSDDGPGVSTEDLPKLFDPFYRADASRDRATGGTGLGLAIVKTCVEACGGRVSARSGEGGGLVVTFTLTRADQAPDQSDSSG